MIKDARARLTPVNGHGHRGEAAGGNVSRQVQLKERANSIQLYTGAYIIRLLTQVNVSRGERTNGRVEANWGFKSQLGRGYLLSNTQVYAGQHRAALAWGGQGWYAWGNAKKPRGGAYVTDGEEKADRLA